MITLGIVLIILSFVIEASERAIYEARESKNEIQPYVNQIVTRPKKTKRVRRRVLKDKEGNMMAEELIEETEE